MTFPHSLRRLVLAALFALAGTTAAVAQTSIQPSIPYDATVDSLFEAGLRLFESGTYTTAYDTFRRVYDGRSANRRTTAAMLMAGKSLYGAGNYEGAIDALNLLASTYPGSRYIEEARGTQALAEEQLQFAEMGDPTFTLGIMLPLGGQHQIYTQDLFDGIRLAVEEHNAQEGARPVRMVFRDSGGQADGVRGIVRQLAEDEAVDAIIGPLYSEEAIAAGRQADQDNVVMLVPLATDGQVSSGERTVYQVNPTFEKRGELMGRHAVQRLRYRRLGVVFEAGTPAEQYAEGFRDAVEEAGGRLTLYAPLPNRRAWYQLADLITPDTLTQIDALYIPVTGGTAADRITTALDGIDQNSRMLPLLGNGEWSDRTDRDRMVRHKVQYTQSFWTDARRNDVRAFDARYRALTGMMPKSNQVYTGYDVAHFLLTRMQTGDPGVSLREKFESGGPYEGISNTIDFTRSRVNDAIHILEYTSGGEVLRN